MQRKAGEIASLQELRRRAEQGSTTFSSMSLGESPEVARIVHELQVCQVELELQNEQLQATSQELERSRDRYFEIYDLAPVGNCNLDPAGTILEVNRAATSLLGVDRAHLVGRKLSSFLSTAEADRLHLQRRAALERGTAVGCEVELCKAGGGPFPVYVSSKALLNPRGEPEGFLCVLLDLSELRRVEQMLHVEGARLRESEARLRQIAERVEDALVLRERDGTFVYVSPAFERIWGRPVAELLEDGSVWEESAHPADRARLVRVQERLQAGSPVEKRYRIRRPDGEERWVRSRFFPSEPMPGKPTRYVGIAQDITAERAREEELRQAQKLEALGSLSSAIAHDFGNLLQGISGCASLALASDARSDRRRVYVEQILDAIQRGSGLIGQMMAFSRKTPAQPRPLRLDTVLTELSTLIESLLGEHILLDLRPGAPGGVILADPVQIEQILMNLAANARDVMPAGGVLSMETEEVAVSEAVAGSAPQRSVRLTIRDTGAGMDERTKARVFEPFFTTKPVGMGTGMGLSTVLAITHSLEGRVDVQSEPGQGTVFVFDFPMIEERPVARAAEAGLVVQQRFKGRALLIEDHSLVRMAVRFYLENLGFDVLEASDAAQALELCDASPAPIFLCVSDVSLPGLIGPRVIPLLQARYPDLQSLFMTATPAHELVAHGILDDTAVVLQKPFGEPELAAQLALLLPAAAQA